MSHARQSVRYRERIAFRLPVSQMNRLRQAADAREARVSELIREAIREKLERIEEHPP